MEVPGRGEMDMTGLGSRDFLGGGVGLDFFSSRYSSGGVDVGE